MFSLDFINLDFPPPQVSYIHYYLRGFLQHVASSDTAYPHTFSWDHESVRLFGWICLGYIHVYSLNDM